MFKAGYAVAYVTVTTRPGQTVLMDVIEISSEKGTAGGLNLALLTIILLAVIAGVALIFVAARRWR